MSSEIKISHLNSMGEIQGINEYLPLNNIEKRFDSKKNK